MKAPEFWQRRQGGLTAMVLSPLGGLYGLAGNLRRTFTTPWQPAVPVICIGNVVAGGAGKTPVAFEIARRLQGLGKSVSFLSRGYGGSETGPHKVDPEVDRADQVGDEPLLLSRCAPTWVSHDRVAGVKAASGDTDVIIMDDGYQNPSVAKACSLLVVDGRYGFGNGHLIPAGPLRESPERAVARADGVVIVGPDDAGVGEVVSGLSLTLPQLRATIVPGPEIEKLDGQKVTAFAGIGQPEKFFKTLTDAGCDVVSSRAYPDHHPYTLTDLDHLRSLAGDAESLLVTTEKDRVRIPPTQGDGIEVLTITLQWEDEAALNSLLNALF